MTTRNHANRARLDGLVHMICRNCDRWKSLPPDKVRGNARWATCAWSGYDTPYDGHCYDGYVETAYGRRKQPGRICQYRPLSASRMEWEANHLFVMPNNPLIDGDADNADE